MNERLLEVTIEVGGHLKAQETEIRRVCMVEWNFREDDFFCRPSDDETHILLEASALGTVFADEDVDELIQRMERSVWQANGHLCHVEVSVAEMHGASKRQPSIEDYELQIA